MSNELLFYLGLAKELQWPICGLKSILREWWDSVVSQLYQLLLFFQQQWQIGLLLCLGSSVKSTVTPPTKTLLFLHTFTGKGLCDLISTWLYPLNQVGPKIISLPWIWNQGWSVSVTVQLEPDSLPCKPSAVGFSSGNEMTHSLQSWLLLVPWLQCWWGSILFPTLGFGEISLGPYALSSQWILFFSLNQQVLPSAPLRGSCIDAGFRHRQGWWWKERGERADTKERKVKNKQGQRKRKQEEERRYREKREWKKTKEMNGKQTDEVAHLLWSENCNLSFIGNWETKVQKMVNKVMR